MVTTAITLGIPTPTFSSALAFFDGYRSDWLPANLIQVSAHPSRSDPHLTCDVCFGYDEHLSVGVLCVNFGIFNIGLFRSAL